MFRKNYFRTLWLCLAVLLAARVEAPALQLAQRETQEWIKRLERPERIANQKVDEVLSRLKLKPGVIVADIGAGTGVFSRPIARAVAPGGKVYAVDILPGLLDYINQRAKEEKMGNIQTVLGEFDDPKLPARDVDLAFFNDVLHHIEHRAAYLKALASYIKPTGRIALIEFYKDGPRRNEPPELLLTKEEVNQWMAAAGFHPLEEFDDLFPGSKWFIIYGRQESSKSPSAP